MKLCRSYAGARCVAITARGKRCTRHWGSAYNCSWQWDPIKGIGIDGPRVVLCRQHSNMAHEAIAGGVRIRIVCGWFGAYNQHKYGSAVWSAPSGWKPAKAWWAHRRDVTFGTFTPRDNEAVA